jgi:hypothetical protein
MTARKRLMKVSRRTSDGRKKVKGTSLARTFGTRLNNMAGKTGLFCKENYNTVYKSH